MESFDYVIIGAGSAGCVMAHRLSAQENVRVCLLEAGPPTDALTIRMPAALTYPIESKIYNWRYASEPEPQLNNRRIGQARGRGLGGSSAINGMVWVRGNPRDYDGWKDFGLEGWSYADCLPYFRKLETFHGAARPERGRDGLMSIVESRGDHVFYERFLQAAEAWGLPQARDYNSGPQDGAHLTQANIRNGVRCSAAEAYLKPVLGRPNLTVRTGAFVRRIRFDGTRAAGVDCTIRGEAAVMGAEREVILCAGTIASPQLLMVSGIGPADHLRQHEIDPILDLPGVGENLQDHVVAPLRYRCDRPVSISRQLGLLGRARIGLEWMLRKTGLGASNFFEVGAFFGSGSGEAYINMQHEFLGFLADFQDGKVTLGDGFQYFVSQMRPHSRGRIRLKSADPAAHPAIHFNYLDDPRDVSEMVDGIKRTREMAAQKPWDEFRSASLDPDLDGASDQDIARWLRNAANTEHHPAGTCRMGTDGLAVTDAEGLVHGVQGLRIVDGSIMPRIPTANIQAPIMMVAEKIAARMTGGGT
jgi:choline dehydrogenase